MASGTTLHFDPDLHQDDTLKAFNEFIQSFYLRYEAQYPDPPKVSIDAAIERWKLINQDQSRGFIIKSSRSKANCEVIYT